MLEPVSHPGSGVALSREAPALSQQLRKATDHMGNDLPSRLHDNNILAISSNSGPRLHSSNNGMSLKRLPTRILGRNGPTVSAIGLGAMGMGAFYGKSDDNVSYETLTYAADRGVTFWDTSNVYGTSEALIGKWFKDTGRRSEIFLATKVGGGPNGSSKPSYVVDQLQKSLKALQTDYIDLYYQHRVDPNVPIEVFLEALRPFVESGQIRWIGLSECSIATMKRARIVKGIGEKVIAAQMEYSPIEISIERNGFAKAAAEEGVAIVAYSPLARGVITGRFTSPNDFEEGDFRRVAQPRFTEENFAHNYEIVKKIQAVARRVGVTAAQISLAWILTEHPEFVPIPGVRTVERLEENARAIEIQLSPEDLKAIRAVADSADVHGSRYAQNRMPKGDCISLSEWHGESA